MCNRLRQRISTEFVMDVLLIMFLSLSIILFILYPCIKVLKEGFFREGRIDLENFKLIWQQKEWIRNSLMVSFATTSLTLITSTATAIYFYFSAKKVQRIIFMILFITMISPPFVTSLSYINLFGRRGYITYHLLKLSLNPYGFWGIVLMQVLGDLSLNSILLIGFIRTIDTAVINSARSLRANTNHLIIDIILPFLKPSLKVVAILSFFRSLSDFGTPAIIGGNFNVLASEGYFAVISEGNLGKAAVINCFLMIPAIIIFIFGYRLLKEHQNVSVTNFQIENEVHARGFLFHFIRIIALGMLSWISVQYVSIFLSSVTKMHLGKVVFTFDNMKQAIPYLSNTLVRSIIYSLIAAIGGSLMGHLIGYYIKIRKFKWMEAINFIATLPYLIPGTFFGLGYLLTFNKKPLLLTGTSMIVILNVLFKQMPFSTQVGNATMSNINQDLIKSVRDLGGNQFYILKDVIWPLSKRGMEISFINAFTKTMTTIGSIIFLVYPSQKVMTLVMFDVIQSGKYEIGSVIATFLILLCVIINVGYMSIIRRL